MCCLICGGTTPHFIRFTEWERKYHQCTICKTVLVLVEGPTPGGTVTQLVAHRGGWEATLGDLSSVVVPEATESYVPVPYTRLVEEVKLHIPRFGLSVEREQYALGREGNQMFGVLTCRNGAVKDWALAIGLRSSYDRSLAVDLVAGSRVFVCDNLAFHGETRVARKHTVNVFRDLPDLIYKMLQSVSLMKERMASEIEAMQMRELKDMEAHDLMVLAIKYGALPASKLPKVLENYKTDAIPEFGKDTAWRLFNAFTGVIGQSAPWQQMDNTLRLSNIFRERIAN